MNIVSTISIVRLLYHANMLDIYNTAGRLGILRAVRVDRMLKKHCLKCVDCIEHMGVDIRRYLYPDPPA